MFMLWHDPFQNPLAERVSRAAAYFQAKYQKTATSVIVPKGTDMTGVSGLTCREDQYVLKNHLMLGGEQ